MGLFEGTTGNYYQGADNTQNTADDTQYGNYQFTSLEHIINQFILAYVGEEKLLSKVRRADVAFHAQRALQEFSFDVFKSTKAQEIEVPATLQMVLPHDYVNYVKLSFSDGAGIKRVITPTRLTSNPDAVTQETDGSYTLSADEIQTSDSDTWEKYKGSTPAENQTANYDYDDDIYNDIVGQRYGIEPSEAQVNGNFYIDDKKGKIHFSSNLSGKTVILDYISDSLGTDAEMKVHKFAEEAMYKNIAYAILTTRANIPEFIIQRFRREAFATKRTAKLRLSNIKLQEIVQQLRGKAKHIKH